jgi:hypothetical protein
MLPRGTVVRVDARGFGDPFAHPVTFARGGKEFSPSDPFLAKDILDALRYDAKGELVVDVAKLPASAKQVLTHVKKFVGARLWCALFKKG